MNHKWNDNVCTECGVKRKKHTFKILMATVNHPPWEGYRYERVWVFLSIGGAHWKAKRPECVRKNDDRTIADMLEPVNNDFYCDEKYKTGYTCEDGQCERCKKLEVSNCG